MGVAALVRVLSKGPPPAGPEQPQLSTRDPNDATTELFTTAERLYREHFEFVWRNARRLGCSDDWVDDAVHEIFLIATRRLAEFEGRSSALTWLFAITFRVVQRMQRDRARQRKHVARYVQEQQTSVDGGERAAQAAEYLRHLLAQLPEAQRAIVILSELEGFTSAEIAEALGTPQGTIDSRLRAARIALARAIERDRKRDERFGS
jgi:RNA polymerase sigma-70 factor (ECF subfamily)